MFLIDFNDNIGKDANDDILVNIYGIMRGRFILFN